MVKIRRDEAITNVEYQTLLVVALVFGFIQDGKRKESACANKARSSCSRQRKVKDDKVKWLL